MTVGNKERRESPDLQGSRGPMEGEVHWGPRGQVEWLSRGLRALLGRKEKKETVVNQDYRVPPALQGLKEETDYQAQRGSEEWKVWRALGGPQDQGDFRECQGPQVEEGTEDRQAQLDP